MRDSELVYNILHRDRRALYFFYKKYKPVLARRIKSKIANPHDAEEVLQDTLYACLEALRDWRKEASVKTYILAICNRKIVDFYRKKRVAHAVFSQMPQLGGLVSPLLTPEDELDAKILREKVRRALDIILPQYKHILLSKYADKESVAEIAEKLSVTLKSAESVLFRARKAFVEAFISL